MKTLIVAIVLLCTGICHASDILIGEDLPPDRLGRCRQDFSVKLCRNHPNQYVCVKFHKGNRPYLTWEELFGDGLAKIALQKINRRNTIVWRHHCLAMPISFTTIIPPLSRFDDRYQGKVVVVDLKQLAWGAYQQGKLVMWGPANGGRGRCKEDGTMRCKTHVGIWAVSKKDGPVTKSSLYPVECMDKKDCGHPMYWKMQFHRDGTSLHGDRNLPGANVSHGCVRLLKSDAKWLNREFVEIGTPIVVLPY
jgi:hypothetical protein